MSKEDGQTTTPRYREINGKRYRVLDPFQIEEGEERFYLQASGSKLTSTITSSDVPSELINKPIFPSSPLRTNNKYLEPLEEKRLK